MKVTKEKVRTGRNIFGSWLSHCF